jgi:hypothetical protein
MTIDELEVMLDAGEAAIGYLGRAGNRTVGKPFVCSITPRMNSRRWRQGAWCMRGSGKSIEAALAEALAELSAFLLTDDPSRE